jgi:hypothetical protein
MWCRDCGEEMRIMFVDDNNIAMVSENKMWNYADKFGKKDKFSYSFTKKEFLSEECQKHFQCGIIGRNIFPDKYINEIEVPSGELIFTNYFEKDELYELPEDIKWNRENSINHLMGRLNLMEYLASKNVGYGQMGNMDVTIFLKDTKDQIIVGSEYGRRDHQMRHKGYTKLGSISLRVWRWMCADKQILIGHGENVEELSDTVVANVNPGRWVVEHYYDITGNDKIYSKLYLKK